MTIHESQILKDTVKTEFYNLPKWQQNAIISDDLHQYNSYTWFSTFVKNRTQQIFEDEARWENEKYINFCLESSQNFHHAQ